MTTLSMSMFANVRDYNRAHAVIAEKKLRNTTQMKNNSRVDLLTGIPICHGYVVEKCEVRSYGKERHVWFLGTQLASKTRGWWYSHKA